MANNTSDLLQKELDDLAALKNAYAAANTRYQNAKAASEECQRLRDQYSVGWKKENACSIETKSSYDRAWDAAVNDMNTIQGNIDLKQKSIDNLQKEISENAQLALQQYASSPQGQADIRKATEAAANRSETTKRIAILGVIVIVIIVGVIVIKRIS